MSGAVITLDGLKKGDVGRSDPCGEIVTVYSPITKTPVQICSADAERIAKSKGVPVQEMKRKPGRPKGTTTKHGAKKPSVKICSNFRKVTNRKGREICRCADPGNSQIQTNSKCGLQEAVMARKRAKKKRAKKSASTMRAGTCRCTSNGVKYCKLQNGKVKFKKGGCK